MEKLRGAGWLLPLLNRSVLGNSPGADFYNDKGVAGMVLESACDPRASIICAADPFFCTNSWDEHGVNPVTAACSQGCL